MPDLRIGENIVVPAIAVNITKYGTTSNGFLGDVNENGAYQLPTEGFDFVGENIKEINVDEAFYHKFYRTSIKSVSFPSLVSLSGSKTIYRAFQKCSSLVEMSFPKLTSISGNSTCYGLSADCQNLASVNFNALTTVSGDNVFDSAFHSCHSLTSVAFPLLTTINGNSACSFTFVSCYNLVSVSFPMLTTISGALVCSYMFSGCTKLTSISFPSLTTIENTNALSQKMFVNCSALTEIHFRTDIQAIVEAQVGYDSKFGATNATIYFDL